MPSVSFLLLFSCVIYLTFLTTHFLANRHAKRDTIKVIDAGGGPGHENLKFSELQERQKSMYKRTLDDPPILQDNRFQETR
jgi:hypothetical protein